MKRFRILLACIVMLGSNMATYNAHAKPANPDPVRVNQPDGTTITVRGYGDEYALYFTTDDGYGIKKGADGIYYYIDDKWDLLPVKAKDASMRTAADRAAMRSVPVGVPYGELAGRREAAVSRLSARNITGAPSAAEAPLLGEHKTLVLLVDFPDAQFSVTDPVDYFNDFFSGDNFTRDRGTGSVRKYYTESSTGQFDPRFFIEGPYHAPLSKRNYDNSYDLVIELIAGVLQQMLNEGFDFTPYVANGHIRNVFMLYAGEVGNNGLWPHMLSGFSIDIGSYKFSSYALSPERENNRTAGIGSVAHEYGHMIGLPDYYQTRGSGAVTPRAYCNMDLGCYNNDGRTPPPMTLINRYMLGWIEPTTINTPGHYELEAIADSNDGYIIRISGEGLDGEYFALETRSADTNVWDEKLGYNGLFVMHIDRTTRYRGRWSLNSNSLNNDASHPCARPVKAVEGNSASRWVFPGAMQITDLSEASHPYFSAWDGTLHNYELSGIAYANGKVTFNLSTKDWIGEVTQNYVNQNDAKFSWDGDPENTTGYYTVVVNDAGTEVFSKTVEKPEVYIPYLSADNAYILKVNVMADDEVLAEKTFEFNTLPIAGDFAYMKIKGSYGNNEEVPLHIFDVQGEIESIEWEVDGASVAAPATTLTSGRHKITAKVTTKDNVSEIITKFVTIM